jgi:hypothetical protein
MVRIEAYRFVYSEKLKTFYEIPVGVTKKSKIFQCKHTSVCCFMTSFVGEISLVLKNLRFFRMNPEKLKTFYGTPGGVSFF